MAKINSLNKREMVKEEILGHQEGKNTIRKNMGKYFFPLSFLNCI